MMAAAWRNAVCHFARSLSVLFAALREIFDEAAYERYLVRSQRESSREAYAHFLREAEQAKSRRLRCC